ncbi:hypothetical protein HOR75_gp68 [Shewanella phage SppYZU05]|uniref:Uncharacterized protein n=1 Tax=Shewanella phage SppYZU05 TaxID=1970795 RepID=A0A1W6JTI5_9CAUD|nr:hypothetical protein HOR75_gp68 [Shewanella phage SppYZU05]ARM70594.1 hypothetical protein SppYZU05_68 [Shewanella phage SppYZU05]
MAAPVSTVVGAATEQISKAEKGGLFVVLVLVLLLGYDLYTKGQERDEARLTEQLQLIAHQQTSLQRAIDDMRAATMQSQEHNRSMASRLDSLEGTALSYVYTTEEHLIVKAPKSAGSAIIRVPLEKPHLPTSKE